MADFVIDTSALLAILAGEPEAEELMVFLDRSGEFEISAATLFEGHCVARRSGLERGNERLDRLIELTSPTVHAFDEAQLRSARSAYQRFGRGTGHPARLNMGDCFAYALATTRRLPLLFKGEYFTHTDVEPALR